nr:class I SAM-dependent methyltransferase [Chitinophagaceae bacterium]
MSNNRNIIKRALLGLHKLGTKLGIHVLPVHYYSPLPDILELKRTREIWAKKSVLPGVSVNLDEQASYMQSICMPYQKEFQGNKFYKEAVSNHFGPGYGYIEAQALHSFIRYFKPSKIVEVGSGVSTFCMLKAAEMNAVETGQMAKIVSIEPYPSESLKALSEIELIIRPVQTVALDVFTNLGENDLLFIDSSHTVKTGGDVNYLFLEVLPRLKKGVIVHIHDIYLPYDYQPDALQSFLHWSETSLLRAFLIFNQKV